MSNSEVEAIVSLHLPDHSNEAIQRVSEYTSTAIEAARMYVCEVGPGPTRIADIPEKFHIRLTEELTDHLFKGPRGAAEYMSLINLKIAPETFGRAYASSRHPSSIAGEAPHGPLGDLPVRVREQGPIRTS